MRGLRALAIMAAVSAAAQAMAGQLISSPMQVQALEPRERATRPHRKRVNLGLADTSTKWKRSRGAQAKPKKRSNRLTISKRVRRRHRRHR